MVWLPNDIVISFARCYADNKIKEGIQKVDDGEQKPNSIEAQVDSQLDPKPDYSGAEPNTDTTVTAQPVSPRSGGLKTWIRQHKKPAIFIGIGAVVCIAGLIIGLTDLRFAVLNLFGKTTMDLHVIDETTKQPVPHASVTVDNQAQATDKKGFIRLSNLAWGSHEFKFEKLAYAIKQTHLTADAAKTDKVVKLHPTGMPLKLTITNKISGAQLAGVKVGYKGADAISDAAGHAVLQVPPQSAAKITVTLKSEGYNDATVDIQADPKVANNVTLTPAGKIFFLSKRTGTINVMKSDLDGTHQEVVLAGTGRENDTDTILLASRDWQYLALKARRDADDKNGSLYLINTSTGTLTTMDAGNINITMVGWSGHTFVYTVDRLDKDVYASKKVAIKSYTAETKKINLIDENQVANGNIQRFTDVYIVDKQAVYGAAWGTLGQQVQIVTVMVDGTGKKAIANYSSDLISTLDARAYDPAGIYFLLQNRDGSSKVVEAEKGAVKDVAVTSQDFYQKFYPTYLLSPSGKATLWFEPRDGKNAVLVGDDDGHNGKTVSTGDTFVAYGWYTDNYLLLAKNSSELYVVGSSVTQPPLKITDYHKPAYNFAGYGGGYGGF